MINTFLSRQVLNSSQPDILKGLILQRSLIIIIALLALFVQKQFLINNFLSKGFQLAVMIGVLYTLFGFIRIKKSDNVSVAELFIHLMLDACLLLLLIKFSGGTSNPFIYYLLVLVAISAALFQKTMAWIYTLFAIFSYTALFYLEINKHALHSFNDFQLHLIGMWINFVASALLIAFFVSSLSSALKQRQLQLAKAREQNLRNEQLVGIGTLAASTVHALRTPLATMAVLLSDMKSEHQNDELAEDLSLLLSQIDRCKETTNKLASLADSPEGDIPFTEASELLNSLQEHYAITHPDKKLAFVSELQQAKPLIANHILLRQALLNLIDNALQAARSEVLVSMSCTEDYVIINIHDDGNGLPEPVLKNWGQPFLSQKEQGLGIGTFLANSTIERFNGRISLEVPGEASPFNTLISVQLPSGTDKHKPYE